MKKIVLAISLLGLFTIAQAENADRVKEDKLEQIQQKLSERINYNSPNSPLVKVTYNGKTYTKTEKELSTAQQYFISFKVLQYKGKKPSLVSQGSLNVVEGLPSNMSQEKILPYIKSVTLMQAPEKIQEENIDGLETLPEQELTLSEDMQPTVENASTDIKSQTTAEGQYQYQMGEVRVGYTMGMLIENKDNKLSLDSTVSFTNFKNMQSACLGENACVDLPSTEGFYIHNTSALQLNKNFVLAHWKTDKNTENTILVNIKEVK